MWHFPKFHLSLKYKCPPKQIYLFNKPSCELQETLRGQADVKEMKDGFGLLISYSLRLVPSNARLTNGHLVEFFFSFFFGEKNSRKR